MLKRATHIRHFHALRRLIPGRIPARLIITSMIGLALAGCNDTASGPSQEASSAFSYDGAISSSLSISNPGASSPNTSSSGVIEPTTPSSSVDSSSTETPTSSSAVVVSSELSSSSSPMPIDDEDFSDPDSGVGIVYSVSVENAQIPARESTSITLFFTDVFGEPATVPETFVLTLSSSCITGNIADYDVYTDLASEGSIRVKYEALAGCVGDDLITFAGDWNGAAFSFERLITIERELISSIEWVSTDPQKIAIRGLGGVGGPETATITFRLRGANNDPIVGDEVSFEVLGASGSLSLAENSAISDAFGQVKAEVRSGTAPTSVSIKATHIPTGFAVTSSSLVVSSGPPLEGNVSLAIDTFSVLGFDFSGGSGANFTISASDLSGNPVPDGLSVLFTSEEGGNIDPQCILANGSCSVRFTPTGVQPPDGRVQILATLKGSEGFIDNNGNKVFDDGDEFKPELHEKGEPYSDNNNNGEYDLGETYIDTNNDGMHTNGNNLWSGPNCQHSTLCDDTPGLIDIGDSRMLVLSSGDSPELCHYGDFPAPAEGFNIEPRGFQSLGELYISDGNRNAENDASDPCSLGNPLPAGTQLTFSASEGSLLGVSNWSVPRNTYSITGPYSITYKAPNEEGADVLILRVSPPGGGDTIFQWPIVITHEDDSEASPENPAIPQP